MKFYSNAFTYDYSFPAVSLAYFLRYPNPYSRHVLSSDVIERYIDPATGRLHTTRLHLKRSKIPSAMLKFLPKGMSGPGDAGQSFILEKSVVDVREGWMETESRNMEWTGVLSVVEKQRFDRRNVAMPAANSSIPTTEGTTAVTTTVTFESKLGQGVLLGRRKAVEESAAGASLEEEEPKKGFFASWSTAGVQRTIELIGVRRTRDALVKSKEGMNVVLERLREGGIVRVLEGMRKDRDLTFATVEV